MKRTAPHTMDKSVYALRRKKLCESLGTDTVALIPSGTVLHHGKYGTQRFRQESNFLYLTGWEEPDALLILYGGGREDTLICQPKDRERERWEGVRSGASIATFTYGFNNVYETPKEGVFRLLESLTKRYGTVAIPKQSEGPFAEHLRHLERKRGEVSIEATLGEMRLIKNDLEVATMRGACEIGALAHETILSRVRPGMREYEVESIIVEIFRRYGADHAYPPIVASGRNALTLHHVRNRSAITADALLLVDAGCELSGYCSDITRTLPARGYFSYPERTIYNLVLNAQLRAISRARAGNTLWDVHLGCLEVLTEGLLTLGVIRAPSLNEALAKRLYKPYFPHSTSHWLGLDVHDAGDYQKDAEGRSMRVLEPGMVITVEPGLYIEPSHDVSSGFWDLGIRIEDDILVTDGDPEVLTSTATKNLDDIELFMSRSQGGTWW